MHFSSGVRDGAADVFVQLTKIQGNGQRKREAAQLVEFWIEERPKGQ
jgi:cold shock CspA family protein